MSPLNFPSSVVQKVVAMGMACAAHMQPVAHEPSGFLFVSPWLLVFNVSKASPERFAMTFRASLGRDKVEILVLLPSGDVCLCWETIAALVSVERSLVLEIGTTLGDVSSLCFFTFAVGLRIPCPSTAMFMPMYGGADTWGWWKTNGYKIMGSSLDFKVRIERLMMKRFSKQV